MKIRTHILGSTVKDDLSGAKFDLSLSHVETFLTVETVPDFHKRNIEYMIDNDIPVLHTGDVVYTIEN